MRQGEFSRAILHKICVKGDDFTTNTMSHDEMLLDEIYKSVTMGSDSVSTLIGKTTDTAMKKDLTAQLEGYQRFANTAREKLEAQNMKVKESGVFTKMSAEVALNMTTLVDNSTTKIAEMMINGSTMGVIEITRKLRETPNAADDTKKVASDFVTFEENNIDKMKTYL